MLTTTRIDAAAAQIILQVAPTYVVNGVYTSLRPIVLSVFAGFTSVSNKHTDDRQTRNE